MKIEKLNRRDNQKTRPLYEACFPEQSERFVDYYYSYKASDNDIYVIRDGKKIVSMLHLNPYRMQLGSHVETLHYLVAPATEEAYRGRGYMTALTDYVLRLMYDRGESFCCLKPDGSEGLYEKFDFVTVYRQPTYKPEHPVLWQREMEELGYSFCKASELDCEDIAKKSSALLARRYSIYAVRNDYYYEILLQQQKARRGGIMMIRLGDRLIGSYLYDRLDGYRVREPLVEKKYEKSLFGSLKICEQNNLMARILCRENMEVPFKNMYLNEVV